MDPIQDWHALELARQALGLSAPSSVVATAFFLYLLFGR
jgi:hypothetical protein